MDVTTAAVSAGVGLFSAALTAGAIMYKFGQTQATFATKTEVQAVRDTIATTLVTRESMNRLEEHFEEKLSLVVRKDVLAPEMKSLTDTIHRVETTQTIHFDKLDKKIDRAINLVTRRNAGPPTQHDYEDSPSPDGRSL